MEIMDDLGNPSVGWCVGDAQTMPTERAFDNSPFSFFRGFEMILPRETMVVEFASAHGSTGGDNLSGEQLLEEVRAVVDSL